MLFAADGFFLVHFAQSANGARLSRQPSLRRYVEMTDRGPPLGRQGQNAQTGHYLQMHNTGIVSDQFSHGPCDASGPPQTGDPVVFSSVHRFARKFHHRREHFWISSRAEVEASVGVMILIESGWAKPWLSGALASAASL